MELTVIIVKALFARSYVQMTKAIIRDVFALGVESENAGTVAFHKLVFECVPYFITPASTPIIANLQDLACWPFYSRVQRH